MAQEKKRIYESEGDDFGHYPTPKGPPEQNTNDGNDKSDNLGVDWRDIEIKCDKCTTWRNLTSENNPTGSIYDAGPCLRCNKLHLGTYQAHSTSGQRLMEVLYIFPQFLLYILFVYIMLVDCEFRI